MLYRAFAIPFLTVSACWSSEILKIPNLGDNLGRPRGPDLIFFLA
jgi:hypothetical protein